MLTDYMRLKRELALYVIFGVLTTVVNILVYLFFSKILNVNYLISNIFAWFLSVLFAYITNRIYVFESVRDNFLKEGLLFFSGRIFSGIVDTALMFVFIELLFVPDLISKIVIQVIVVILNYLFSKLIVFK